MTSGRLDRAPHDGGLRPLAADELEADGGPGLPLLGWSTLGGDLRIPHFVGLHGLQVMILLGLALTALGRRHAVLASEQVRTRLVFVGAAGYLALTAVLTWQALRGQSIVHPDLRTGVAFTGVAVAVLIADGCGAWAGGGGFRRHPR